MTVDETGAPTVTGQTALKNAAERAESWKVEKTVEPPFGTTADDKQEWGAF